MRTDSDPETPAKIAATFPTLSLALDTISESKTTQATAKSLGTKGSTPRKILHLLAPQPEDNAGVDVVIEPTLVCQSHVTLPSHPQQANFTLSLDTVIGKEFEMRGKHFPANPQDKIDMTAWLDYVPSLIEAGKFKSNPVWKQPGGLERIGEGLELLKANKVSGAPVRRCCSRLTLANARAELGTEGRVHPLRVLRSTMPATLLAEV